MKNYRKTVRTLKKARFLSIWAAVFALAASLVLTGCDKLMGKPIDGGTSLQGSKIRIKYNPDELGIRKWDKTAEKWIDIASGMEVDEDNILHFKAKNVPSGKVVDKWTLNGKKEIPSNGNSVQYKVNLKDADSENTITVTRTFKDAASITIKYDSNELIVRTRKTTNEKWKLIFSGTEVYEGWHLSFSDKNTPSGKMVEKWLLNGKKEVMPHYSYSVSAKDAVDEGGKKVIKVERILKDAASITIKYNADEMTIENTKVWTNIPSGTAVDEGAMLFFEAKNIPSGKMVEKWLLNGKELSDTGNSLYYTVKAKDAVDEDGTKVIRITRTLKDAASITIKYNTNEMTIEKNNTSTGEWEGISSGTAVDEGTDLFFEAKNILSGKMLEKWLLNGKKEVMPRYNYSVSAKDAIEEGGKKVIKVERILKDAASITIKYNADEMTIEKRNNDNWETLPTDTPVDEGTSLRFKAKNILSGKMLEKWLLNGKIELHPHAVYSVRPEDAVEEGGKKVIKVERILKDAASITIKYNANEMTVKNINGWTNILSGTAVDEGTYLFFEAKNIPSGKMVEKWLLNGKEEVMPGEGYSVRPEDAVEEGGKKVIKVERILKDAASITIKYNANEMTIEKRNNDNWETLPTDTPVDEGTELIFQPKNGQTVNKWILNGKKELHPHAGYSVSAEDAVEEGSKKVIVVTFE